MHNQKEFKKKVRECFDIIKAGCEEGKCLVNDGLLKLSLEQLQFLSSDYDGTIHCGASVLIFLCIMIQAYPGDKWEFEEGADYETMKALEGMINLCLVCKLGYLEYVKYGKNKIDLDQHVMTKPSEKAMEMFNLGDE